MTSQLSLQRLASRSGFGLLLAVSAMMSVLRATAQLSSSGFSVSSPTWEVLITEFGYADLALDRRPGFVGREFLSGEWGAAVLYSGGQNPTMPIWLQPQWFFPDWLSNSDFGVETPFGFANPSNPNNPDGFPVFQSVITNRDLRITMTYEMLDSGTGIAQGTTPQSAGPAGSSTTSDRYVFRQTYRITNRSGGTLTNLRLFQFMHGLEMATSLYDNRDYGGLMGEYRYDNTQRGTSFGFDTRTGQIVEHSDTLAFHSKVMPSAFEVGYYGRKGTDSHVVGKPSVGVHLKVEANSLNGTDFFEPPENRWVGGAQRFDLGTLAPGATVTNDVLLTIETSFQVRFAGANVIIHNTQMTPTNTFIIDFQETIGGPLGYSLSKSTNVALVPSSAWEPLNLPYFINFPKPGWNRFVVPVNPNEPRCFYLLRPVIQQ